MEGLELPSSEHHGDEEKTEEEMRIEYEAELVAREQARENITEDTLESFGIGTSNTFNGYGIDFDAFTMYDKLLLPDPAGRRHPTRPKEIRRVPGFKYLQMIHHREKTVRDILAYVKSATNGIFGLRTADGRFLASSLQRLGLDIWRVGAKE
ncbi:hypothetical protein M7I_4639 [Glarea lozoyensis 74030]|uniref:Uncharacterized protein n=1 Tax=Glarea lozoyensis (strain ATCC 74030 / MF5533) TaxID=1104152 RepID=H0EPQ3_GLAL7|nr:hypothetical protein M7I_4639 [Glarea lozoyensis 74030]